MTRSRNMCWLVLFLFSCLFCPKLALADEPVWKTAYIKRGVVGAYQDIWARGAGSIFRSRTPLAFDGTCVKVLVTGCYQTQVELEHLFLVRGADDMGKVTGTRYPILFDAKPGVTFSSVAEKWSDETQIPVTAGTWYVQDSYLTPKMPYAYDVDSSTCEARGADAAEQFSKTITGARIGILTRMDVLTTDSRMSVVCYGDSITHGYAATPNGDKRYPDQLAKLLKRPVLNMGVNGDTIQWPGGIPGSIQRLKGVDTVIFLLGINDLIAGSVKQLPDYTTRAKQVIDGLKSQKLKVYIGTLLPGGGYPGYDKKMPEIETLRQEINTWIVTWSGADGVIDFAKAMADSQHPEKLKAELQQDWLHPNDAGYKTMAEVAADAMTHSDLQIRAVK